jgi:hypothetical protein
MVNFLIHALQGCFSKGICCLTVGWLPNLLVLLPDVFWITERWDVKNALQSIMLSFKKTGSAQNVRHTVLHSHFQKPPKHHSPN